MQRLLLPLLKKCIKVEVKNQMIEIIRAMGWNPIHHSVARLVKDSESPLSLWVESCPVPHRFKLPTLKSFNCSSDLIDHWQQFQTMMGLQDVPYAIMWWTITHLQTLSMISKSLGSNLRPTSWVGRSILSSLPTFLGLSRCPKRVWRTTIIGSIRKTVW